MDKIIIRDLGLEAIIGINPEERLKKQQLLFNIEISCELRKAAQSDDIRDTVDYKNLKKKIINHVEQSQYMLLEKMAETVAELCMKTDGVEKVKLTVDKPGALRYARSVAIQIERP